MKTENKIIVVSVTLGAVVGAIHYVLDLILLHKTALGDSSWPHALHAFCINIGILLCFAVFGYVSSHLIAKQRRMEQQFTESPRYLAQMLESLPIPVFYKDEKCIYKGCNDSFADFLGLSRQEIIGKTVHDLSPPDYATIYHEKDVELINDPGVQRYEFVVNSKFNGGDRQVIFHKATFNKPDGRVGGIIGALLDITASKKAEREKERLIQELREALTKVKRLSGLLPICAHCKKIRDDNGYWEQIEAYIHNHSEAEFSHSICPECAKKLYPDYADSLSASEEKRAASTMSSDINKEE